MSVIMDGIHVVRNTAIGYLVGDSAAFGGMSSDLLSPIINFKEMGIAFIHVYFDPLDLPDADDFTFQILVSTINDPDSFVPFNDPTLVPAGCPGVAWNIQDFGFLYARVKYVKGTVTSGSMKMTVRAKKG